MRRRRDPRRISESSIQISVAGLLRATARRGVMWLSVPNELPATEGKLIHFTRMGMKAGVSDLLVIIDGHLHCLELKTKSGKQRESQRAFELECNINSVPYAVAHSFEEAKAVLQGWGALKGVVLRSVAA